MAKLPSKQLSEQQQKMLSFLKQETQERGYPPSIREIGSALGYASPSTVQHHLRALEKAGYIRRDPTKPRALTFVLAHGESLTRGSLSDKVLEVPLIGDVAAGVGVLAEQRSDTSLALPLELLGSDQDNLFLLKVRGDSMVDLGIFEDDLVVVKPQITARNGEIVVALINGGQDGTVKVYEDRDGRPKLKARNATYGEERSTIYFRDERDGIIGKVISLIRRY